MAADGAERSGRTGGPLAEPGQAATGFWLVRDREGEREVFLIIDARPPVLERTRGHWVPATTLAVEWVIPYALLIQLGGPALKPGAGPVRIAPLAFVPIGGAA